MTINKKKNYKLFFIFFAVSIYTLNFYLKNFSPSGSQLDLYGFVFKNIQLFREDLIYAVKNYGLLGDANYPLFYIFHAYLNPFSNEIKTYLFSTFAIGLFTFLMFSLCLRSLEFELIDSLFLSSIILILPWFAGRAYWRTSANLGWFFLIVSFYFFIKVKKNIKLSYNSSDSINIFFLCLFSAAALYVRVSLIFFPIFLVCYVFFYDNLLKRKFLLLLFYSILSLPGFFLIFIWGGIYDHTNSNVVKELHTYKNIFQNFPILLNFFFFYLWPIFLLEIREIGIISFCRKTINSFAFIFIFFLFLNFTGHLSYLSEYTYGGGAILKIGYLINDNNNLLFLITSSIGFSMIYMFIREDYKKNLILFLPLFIIYGFPKYLYQDYLEPLIIFLFFLGFIKTSLFYKLKQNVFLISMLYIIYFLLTNISASYLRSFNYI